MKISLASRGPQFLIVGALMGVQAAVLARAGEPKPPEDSAPPAVSIVFLEADAARLALLDDSAEPYFDRLGPLEMHAKTGRPMPQGAPEAQLAELRTRYAQAVEAFTDSEKATITRVVGRIQPLLLRDYPVVAEVAPWRFLKLGPGAEFGLAHTRGTVIAVPARTLGRLTELEANPRGGFSMDMALGGLLLHERLHVVQRARPAPFRDLYANVWGFRQAQPADPSGQVEARRVVNPDATDVGWVFPMENEETGERRWIWPRVLLEPGDEEPSVRSMRSVGLELEKRGAGFTVKLDEQGRPLSKPLDDLPDYTRHFAAVRDLHHPHEIAASLFSRIVIFDDLMPQGLLPPHQRQALEARYAPIRAWFREHLKSP